MASPESMKKDELVTLVRKLTQEAKKLTAENEALKKDSAKKLTTPESLDFDCLGIAFKMNGNAESFEVHLIDYDSKSGQGVVKEKEVHDRRYHAEYRVKEMLHYKIFKGGLK